MKRVYWVNRKGNIVLGEVLLAEGFGTREELLQEANEALPVMITGSN